jgi:hypothetical protein
MGSLAHPRLHDNLVERAQVGERYVFSARSRPLTLAMVGANFTSNSRGFDPIAFAGLSTGPGQAQDDVGCVSKLSNPAIVIARYEEPA